MRIWATISEAILLYQRGVPSLDPRYHCHARTGNDQVSALGVNFQQEFAKDMWAFGRWGWNDGKTESFAYTEDEAALRVGTLFCGHPLAAESRSGWGGFRVQRHQAYHQQYLADGGLGFILGDGGLTYGRETIEEAFYTVHAWRGLFFAFDLQHINNPGYNQVRGPRHGARTAAASGVLNQGNSLSREIH